MGRGLLIGLACVACGGCYASTDPATDVGQSSATLHAHGTANNGEAQSAFELWPTGSPSRPVSTGAGFRWPAGASGPFSAKVEGLYPSTSYSFRICGRDLEAGGPFICAQTLTFTTKGATQDELWGAYFGGPCCNGYVRAKAGPNGENASGHLSASDFNGFVTCLHVSGNRAAVGGVGTNSAMLMTVVDNGPTGIDTVQRAVAPAAVRPNCTAASFANQVPVATDSEGFIVIDAP
ncbi:MAG: hypothetical protein QOE60_2232 [Thermoleophilaceae bacterium]|jgi:hypothetical protein|nr:hypothetical protein [Thermoleophilaceae bacterium]